ncbi:MAG: GNAT family N-acetyltransferase [Chlorobiota bacterium]
MAEYKVCKYSPEDYEQWQDFVSHGVNATLFHEQKFISYHPEGKFDDHSLMVYKKDELFSVFPAALLIRADKKVLKSHPGTSYGGCAFAKGSTLKDVYTTLEAIENYANQSGISRIEFRQAPKIFLTQPFDQLDFSLVRLNYEREDEELSTCYPLSSYKDVSVDDMAMQFENVGRNKVRKNVRKAVRRGLTFRQLEKSEHKAYYDILLDNLVRHEATPAHSFEDIEKLIELYPDRVRLYGVFVDGNMAAGYLIFNINHIGWHVFYGSLDYKYQKERPTTYGLFMLLKTLADEGYEYLNMGISTEDGGKKINWGLFDFKESFNGTGIIRTYWSKNIE